MDGEIRQISPTHDDARALFRLLDRHNTAHCPPGACHLTQPEELARIDAVLFGVYCDGVLCGMGAIKLIEDYAEVSRMFVMEGYRGRGLACRLLRRLEQEAAARDKLWLKLETSDRFEPACRLYLKQGFTLCEPFGAYVHATHQHTYMEKRIA